MLRVVQLGAVEKQFGEAMPIADELLLRDIARKAYQETGIRTYVMDQDNDIYFMVGDTGEEWF